MKYKVLYASRYDFVNGSGERVAGAKVIYVDTTNHNTEYAKGCPALTVSAPWSVFDKFSKLPGEYNLEFSMMPDNRGRPTLSILDVSPVAQ